MALDLPGHGRSQHRPAGAWYHYIDYLGDVLAAADALQWERFVLLGHSLGGAVASVLAAAAPERVQQLWAIEAMGPLSTEPAKSLEVLRRAMAERGLVAGKSLRVFPDLERAVAARMQANGLSTAAARTLVERGTRAVEGGYAWSSDPRLTMTSAIRLTEEQYPRLPRGHRMPGAGAHGRPITAVDGSRADGAALRPGARTRAGGAARLAPPAPRRPAAGGGCHRDLPRPLPAACARPRARIGHAAVGAASAATARRLSQQRRPSRAERAPAEPALQERALRAMGLSRG